MKKNLLKYGLLSVALLLGACGNTDEAPSENDGAGTSDATIKALYTAPHGNQSFASTFVVMDGDVVADVIIDEYQFMEKGDWTGVPNAENTFGEKYSADHVLISKRENSEGYSAMMSDIAGSTTTYNDNLDAIQDFAKGKTVAEIEQAIADLGDLGEDGEIVDVVSGATFVDTPGYLQSIVDTINDGIEFAGEEGVDLSGAQLSSSLQAPHGDQSFAIVAALHNGDNVLAAAVDELQFLDPADFDGVPNSDETFGENYNADAGVLASKMFNDDAYSALMANVANATSTYGDNMATITGFAAGSAVDEISAAVSDLDDLGEDDAIADVISGATFVDTAGYLQAILDTIQ